MNRERMTIFLAGALILSGAVLLRVYGLERLTEWGGDAGGDLLVAQNILYYGHRPLVGTYLTVDGFFLPPVYFYILAFLLYLGSSPLGVVALFAAGNVIAGVLLALLAARIAGARVGLTVLLLFSVSSVMADHGRSVYSAYPVIPFLTASMYVLWISLRQHSVMLLTASLLLYSVAAGIYPSPWLLFPVFVRAVYLFFRQRYPGRSRGEQAVRAAGSMFLAYVPVALPQLIFEFRNGFPTAGVLLRGSGGLFPAPGEAAREYGIYLYQLINQFFGVEVLLRPPYAYGAAAVIFLCAAGAAMTYRRYMSSVRSDGILYALRIFHPGWFAVSFVPVILFWENAYHRLWVYYPLLFVYFALGLSAVRTHRHVLFRACMGVLLAYFVLGNVAAQTRRINRGAFERYGSVQSAASFIIRDASSRGIGVRYRVLYYTPYGTSNYNLPAILYFLQRDGGYPVRFLPAGNDIDRYTINTPDTPLAYLVCRADVGMARNDRLCRDIFEANNPRFRLDTVRDDRIGRIFVFIRTRQ